VPWLVIQGAFKFSLKKENVEMSKKEFFGRMLIPSTLGSEEYGGRRARKTRDHHVRRGAENPFELEKF